MDGEGDAGGGCSGEIGEVRVDSWIAGAALHGGSRTGKGRARGPGCLFSPARGSVRLS